MEQRGSNRKKGEAHQKITKVQVKDKAAVRD